MLPGETFDSIYSLAPPDCSLKYFRQTYSVHCIRIYMYATNINEEILFVNHKNPLCEQNKSAPEYRFIITSGHFRLLHKIRALSRYLLVFNFRFSFFRYKSWCSCPAAPAASASDSPLQPLLYNKYSLNPVFRFRFHSSHLQVKHPAASDTKKCNPSLCF